MYRLAGVVALAFLVACVTSSCLVTDFGAVGDNVTDNTLAFRAATTSTACNGEVVVPAPGAFLTGPFNMSSNTRLNVEIGATVSGSRDPGVYPVVTQQGRNNLLRH